MARRTDVIGVMAGVVVAALIVGLVWSPWRPGPPSAVHVTSPTATSAVITWSPSGGIASPGSYLVLRDGRQVGQVPSSASSYTDHGLVLGTTYRYTVVADGWFASAASATATVTTLAPSPAGLTVTNVSYKQVTLHWKPSSLGPAPGQYTITSGAGHVATLPGTVTSYTDTGLSPGAAFRYRVVARWGARSSVPPASVSGQTLRPPLSGNLNVVTQDTNLHGDPVTADQVYQWADHWHAAPSCGVRGCTVFLTGSLHLHDGAPYRFAVTMLPSSYEYAGAIAPRLITCGGAVEPDRLVFTMTTDRGAVLNGEWTSWTATVVLSAPAAQVGGNYCPATYLTYAVTPS